MAEDERFAENSKRNSELSPISEKRARQLNRFRGLLIVLILLLIVYVIVEFVLLFVYRTPN
ncbi:MAG: hypothetical protein LUC31_01395 [Coprobacillus sp.]|nr:hypothetical protein [Coprobacillus sp.]